MTPEQKLGATLHIFMETYPGVDPFGVYCQFTGKQIGLTHPEEIHTLIQALPGDAEDCADDLAIRLFASLRPSMRWNKMRSETLNELRKSAPCETLAYLVNRLFTPLSSNGENYFHMMHDRIRTYTWAAACQPDFIQRLSHILLAIDAKLNLATEWPTFRLSDLIDSPSDEVLFEIVEAWHDRRVKAFDALVKRQEQETNFWRSGSALAKPAFFASFMESKPITPEMLKRQAKKSEAAFMVDILSELMGKPDVQGVPRVPVPPQPVPVAIRSTKMPMKFGVKKLETQS